MRQVSVLLVQDGPGEQLGCEQRLLDLLVLIDDADAVPVVDGHAPRRDHADRVRRAVQQRLLVEERQVRVVERDGEGVVPEDAKAPKLGCLPAHVIVIAHDILGCPRVASQLLHLRRDAKQHGERVVGRLDRRPVTVGQVVVDRERIGAVARLVLRHDRAAHHGRVDLEQALHRVPADQVIAMDQGTHVDVARNVPPHLREEFPVERGCAPHRQLVIVIDRRLHRGGNFGLSLALLCKEGLGQHACCQACRRQNDGSSHFLFAHTVPPPLLTRSRHLCSGSNRQGRAVWRNPRSRPRCRLSAVPAGSRPLPGRCGPAWSRPPVLSRWYNP